MIYPRTVTQMDMRGINRSAILELVRRKNPISRNEVAKELNTSLPTVSRIIDELLEEGLIYEHAEKEWSGGRRRSRVSFSGERHAIVGVDLSGPCLYASVATIGGTILNESEAPFSQSAEDNYQSLLTLIQRLLQTTNLEGRILRGVGVGTPGTLVYKAGEQVTWTPRLKWQDFPLKSRLEADLLLPISVENDINLAAIGEFWFGAGQKYRTMVLLSVGTGIGAGIILEGALYRGSHNFAGEAGYMLPGKRFFGQHHIDFGALESQASSEGILGRARQTLQGRMPPSELDALNVDQIFLAAEGRIDWAQEVIDETIDFLAIAIGNITVLLDPETIVLGGKIACYADSLIPPILNRLETVLPIPPNLVPSKLRDRPVVLGATAAVLHSTDAFYLVRRLP